MFSITNLQVDENVLNRPQPPEIDLESFCVLGASFNEIKRENDASPTSEPERQTQKKLKRHTQPPTPLLLSEHDQATISTLFEGATIPTNVFLACLINMLVGRESIMFIWRRSSAKFVTKHFAQPVKVLGVSATALQGLVDQCLVIGSLFTRLSNTASDIARMVSLEDSIMIAFRSALTDILAAIQHYIETLDSDDESLFPLLVNLRPVSTIVHLLANILGCGDLSRALSLQSLPDPVKLLSELHTRLSIYQTSDINLYILTAELFKRCLSPWMFKLHGIIGLNGATYWKTPSKMVDAEMFVAQNENSGFLVTDKSKLPTFLSPENAQICVEILTALHILYSLGDTSVVDENIGSKIAAPQEQAAEALIPPLDFDSSVEKDAETLLKPAQLFSDTLSFLKLEKTEAFSIFESEDPLKDFQLSIEQQQQAVNDSLMKHVKKYLFKHLESARRFFLMGLGSTDLCQLVFQDNTVRVGSSLNWPPLNSDLRITEDLVADLLPDSEIRMWFGTPQNIDGGESFSPESIKATGYITVFYTPPEELKYVFMPHIIKGYQRIFARLLKLARCVLFLQLKHMFSFHYLIQLQYCHFQIVDTEWYRLQTGVGKTSNFMRIVNLHNSFIDAVERKLFLFSEEDQLLNDYLQSLLIDEPVDIPKHWRKFAALA
ncbi:Spindle pole body component [Yarrowia sp. B02]|nr:Spindle pole body component [Yarrowia sp. B02]